MRSTPLGPHIQTAGALTTEGRAWAREAGIVKQMDGISALAEAAPGAITIYRRYFAESELERALADHQWTCEAIAAGLAGFRPAFVQLLCERYQNVDERLAEHITLTRYAVRWFAGLGIRVAGFAFSTGSPRQEAWELLRRENYGDLREHGGVILLDEYWGYCGPVASQWNARRHELIHQWTQGDHPDFIIGETGRDAVYDDMPPEVQAAIKAGHADEFAGWKRQPVTPDQYAEELLAYRDGLPAYVLGVTPFGIAPYPDWAHFTYDEIVPTLRARTGGWYVAALPSEPARPVVTSRGEDRTVDAQSYFYLEWAQARKAHGEDHRDVVAFCAHLKAVGKDASDPYKAGFPCSPKA